MPHDRGPPKAKMGRYVHDVGKERIHRIVLVFAPPREPEATVIENDNPAVLSQSGGNPDPVVGIEVVASMQDDDGSLAARADLRPEGAVEYRYISRLNFSCAMQRRVHGGCSPLGIRQCVHGISRIMRLSPVNDTFRTREK